MNSRSEDMVVNACKAKKTTNMRAAGSDEAIKLSPARIFTLEEALDSSMTTSWWKSYQTILGSEKNI
jgi:predicted membrane GTPase involved in stress response